MINMLHQITERSINIRILEKSPETILACGNILDQVHNIAIEMEEAALERVKPGLDLNDVWKASAMVFKKHYPNTDSSNWIWLRTGHGIGLDYSDPIVTEAFRYPYELSEETDAGDRPDKTPIRIAPGMLLMLHPTVFIPGEAAGAIGDMVLVTEDGNEILNGFPRELIVL